MSTRERLLRLGFEGLACEFIAPINPFKCRKYTLCRGGGIVNRHRAGGKAWACKTGRWGDKAF
jgi:hypothetical protein